MSAPSVATDDEKSAFVALGLDGDGSGSTIEDDVPLIKKIPASKAAKSTGLSRPTHRDGMGRYKIPPGGRPLTIDDIPGPGPSDYSLEYEAVEQGSPMWSFRIRNDDIKEKKIIPAPNKYNTSVDLNWGRCKHFTFKQKLEMRDKNLAYPGPAAYSLSGKSFSGPKFTMRLKPKTAFAPGLVNKLALLPDPKNPGPSYNAPSDEWLKKPQSFGLKQKEINDTFGPGPQKYSPRTMPTGPLWSLGEVKSIPNKFIPLPGPDAYTQKSIIGDAPKYSMGIVLPHYQAKFLTPGPDVYNSAGIRLDEPGYTLKYRWFDTRQEQRPGPYSFSDDQIMKNSPAYSMAIKGKLTYPSSVYSNSLNEGPAPNQYNVPRDPLNKGKTVSSRLQRKDLHKVPGPADYQDSENVKVILPRAPAYSMGGKWGKKTETGPGPGEYDVQYQDSKPGKSIGLRFRAKAPKPGSDVMYDPVDPIKLCPTCNFVPGATLKGRHTPHKYLGLKDNAKLMCQPKDFPQLPFFG